MMELKVTERAMLKDKKTPVSALEKLKKIGVSIAINDYGTGYSSLSCLLELPAYTLKIE
jgi:EAL domain-containing protein (putative c-di-GMP-specific phosphodiesterase class I)